MSFREIEILEQLDLAYFRLASNYYPEGNKGDIKYNFFLDLENGYFAGAGNRIHLYADSERWAIVFEQSGYYNRRFSALIELMYVGNCIDYPIAKYPDRNYISNMNDVILISDEEFERIRNREGTDMEQFERISPTATIVDIRNVKVNIEHDPQKYKQAGIKISSYDNPNKLVGYEDFIRYLNETTTGVISATEDEIKMHIPSDLPKLMTMDKYHYESMYSNNTPPSKQETYQLIAKVLVTMDATKWMPALKPNNHWSNWKSGNL